MPLREETRLHNQLMRAATDSSSRGFFPPGPDPFAGPSRTTPTPNSLDENASFLPDMSGPPQSRTRKLSNKLMKKRPTLLRGTSGSGSAPPSSFRGAASTPSDDFVDAVTAQVDMLTSSLPRKAAKKSERALAERSFASPSPAGLLDDSSLGTSSRGAGPSSRSQGSDSTNSTGTTSSNSYRDRSLQRSSSSIQLGSAYRSSPQPQPQPPQPDPFQRGPIIVAAAERATPSPVYGTATTRYPGEEVPMSVQTPMKKWVPRDNRGTIIALYKPPSTGDSQASSSSSRLAGTPEVDDTVIALYKPPPGVSPPPARATPSPVTPSRGRSQTLGGAERDDTIIALYKPPPPSQSSTSPTNAPSSSLTLPTSRDAPRRRSNSLAFVPGTSAGPSLSHNSPSEPIRSDASEPISRSGSVPNTSSNPASGSSVSAQTPSSNAYVRARSNTVGPGSGSRPFAYEDGNGEVARPPPPMRRDTSDVTPSSSSRPHVHAHSQSVSPALTSTAATAPRPLRSALKRPVAPPPLAYPPAPPNGVGSSGISGTSAPAPVPARPPRSQRRPTVDGIGTADQLASSSLGRPAALRSGSTPPYAELARPSTAPTVSSSTVAEGPTLTRTPPLERPMPSRIPPLEASRSRARTPTQTHKTTLSTTSSESDGNHPRTPPPLNEYNAPVPRIAAPAADPYHGAVQVQGQFGDIRTRTRKRSEPSRPPFPTAVPSPPPIPSTSPYREPRTRAGSSPGPDASFLPSPTTPNTPGSAMGDIGRSLLVPISEAPSPISPSFGGKASDIRMRILSERGGRY